MKKKIVLTSIDAGSGHNAARDSLYESLKDLSKYKVVKFQSSIQTFDSMYKIAAGYFSIHDIIYNMSDYELASRFILDISLDLYLECFNMIKDEDPDLIISSHPLTSPLFVKARNQLKHRTKVVSLYPDYGPMHKLYYTEHKNYQPDRLWVISEVALQNAVEKHKISRSSIDRVAILPSEVFIKNSAKKKSKKEWREQLIKNLPETTVGKINPNLFTILLLGGGGWASKLEPVLESLNEWFSEEDSPKFQVLVVSGKDEKFHEKIYKKIIGKKYKFPVIVFGFIPRDQMALSQLSADQIILGSLGGAILREIVFTATKQVLIFNHLGGQEEGMVNYLVKRGLAKYTPSLAEITNKITSVVENPGKVSKDFERDKKSLVSDHLKYSMEASKIIDKLI